MSGISYDFDRRPLGSRRGRDPHRFLQLFLIFCVVAAVTVGVVFWIIPDKPELPAPQGDTPAATGETGKKPDDGGALLPENSAAGSETTRPAETPSAVTAEKKEPEPVYPPGKTAAAAAALEKIRKISSPAEKIAAAEAFMLAEAKNGGEFSRDFLTAGQLLAEARETAPGFEIHRVAGGENLSTIANKNYTTVKKILKDNALADDRIRIGQKLKLIRSAGPWEVRVSRSARVLSVWRHTAKDKLVPYAAYPVVRINLKSSVRSGSALLLNNGALQLRDADKESLILLLPQKTIVKIEN